MAQEEPVASPDNELTYEMPEQATMLSDAWRSIRRNRIAVVGTVNMAIRFIPCLIVSVAKAYPVCVVLIIIACSLTLWMTVARLFLVTSMTMRESVFVEPPSMAEVRDFYLLFRHIFRNDLGTFFFFFSSRRRHTRYWRDWSSDVFRSRSLRELLSMRCSGYFGKARCRRSSWAAIAAGSVTGNEQKLRVQAKAAGPSG